MVQLSLSPPEYSVLMALLEDSIESKQNHPLLDVFAALREKIVLAAGRNIAS
jgi:hypothetical protein